jgi:hypothetical protein
MTRLTNPTRMVDGIKKTLPLTILIVDIAILIYVNFSPSGVTSIKSCVTAFEKKRNAMNH